MALILVVDDEDTIRGFLRHFLEKAGHEVVEAADGVRALQHYQAFGADLVLLDIFMPEMDGLECLRELLRLDHKARVVMISGGASRFPAGMDFLRVARLLGAAGTLHKPMSSTQLVAAIDMVLQRAERALTQTTEDPKERVESRGDQRTP